MKSARSMMPAAAAAVLASSATGQTCAPHWTGIFQPPVGQEVRSLRVLDDGSGQALYVGMVGTPNGVGRWNGSQLTLLGSVSGALQSSPSGVYSLEMFDDGSGAALHIGGSFTAAGGTMAHGVAKRTGAGWQPLGQGMDGGVRALLVHDDGSGAALYAGGYFTSAGGLGASRVARWDGGHWSALGSGLTGGTMLQFPVQAHPAVYALASFDDGHGPALYAGGLFAHAGGSPAGSIARWKNGAWEPVGNGLSWNGTDQALVITMRAHIGSVGPSLYVGGRVNFGAQNENPLVARWNGVAWNPVGAWLPGYYVTSFAEAGYWGANALHASIYPYNTPPLQGSVFRLDGNNWVTIGMTETAPVRVLLGYSDGGGATDLLAGGAFSNMSGVYAGRLARWIGCGDGCYADCDGNGLSVADFGCFQSSFAAGSSYADCNADSVLTAADFGCFQTRFVAGCP